MTFAAGLQGRLLLAVAVAGAGAAAVWAVEGRRAPVPAPSSVPSVPAGTRPVAIVLTASTPMAAWSVSHQGSPLAGTADERSWRGSATVPMGAEDLLVEARPVDAGASAWALRLEAQGPGIRCDRTAWAPGTQVELLALPAAAAP
jgi:hypothetical protein